MSRIGRLGSLVSGLILLACLGPGFSLFPVAGGENAALVTITLTQTVMTYETTTTTRTTLRTSTYRVTTIEPVTTVRTHRVTVTPTVTITEDLRSTASIYSACTTTEVVTTTTSSTQVKEKWINMRRFNQIQTISGKPYWCGQFAVTNMINYYLGERKLSSDEVVSVAGDRMLWTWELEPLLNHFSAQYSLNMHATTIWTFDITKIIEEIDSDRPVALYTSLGGPVSWFGHFTIVIGYRITRSVDGQMVGCSVMIYDDGVVKCDDLGLFRVMIVFN